MGQGLIIRCVIGTDHTQRHRQRDTHRHTQKRTQTHPVIPKRGLTTDDSALQVLVFSQSLTMLDVIEAVLKKNPVGSSCWKAGQDYYRLDGSKSSKQRQGDIDNFNDIANTRARLFLISTRAGSLGVNMVAANRVVLFDCNFNPSYDLQAIFRTYRCVGRVCVCIWMHACSYTYRTHAVTVRRLCFVNLCVMCIYKHAYSCAQRMHAGTVRRGRVSCTASCPGGPWKRRSTSAR